MLSLFIIALLYFLPAIIGRDKSDATGIFLLNLFLGWTLIGWVAAFIWACASDRPVYVKHLVPASGAGRFCSHCGTPAVAVVQYCSSCGSRV
ncbi:MAG TPA: superinfection immunity protein [Candidatus Acidoferrum sp.]